MKKLLALILLTFACSAFGQSAQTNSYVKAVPLGAYTQTEVDGHTFNNLDWNSVQVSITVTGYVSGTYTPHIQGIDMDGVPYDLVVGAAISGNTATGPAVPIVLYVGPGYLALPNVSAATSLPVKWRVILVGASTPSMTVVANANLGVK